MNNKIYSDKIIKYFGLENEFINTIEGALNIDSIIPKHPIVPFYRGEVNSEWNITPGIGRKDKYPVGFNFNDFNFQKFEKEIFYGFYKPSNKMQLENLIEYEYHNGSNLQNWKLLAQYQHLRGMTSMIDFTQSILTALYFATQFDKENEDKAGHIWVLHDINRLFFKPKMDLLAHTDPFNADNNILIPAEIYSNGETKASMYNWSNQKGQLFKQKMNNIETPLNHNEEVQEYLYRLIIPASAKPKIREALKGREATIYSNETIDLCTKKLVNDAFTNALSKYL